MDLELREFDQNVLKSYEVDIHRILRPHLESIESLKEVYKAAKPFPSIAIDNFLPKEIIDRLCSEFPSKDSKYWKQSFTSQTKFATENDDLPFFSRQLIQELNSLPFVEFLEAVTGVKYLITDARLSGGGLHRTDVGGFLPMHSDFNRHTHTWLDRRINILIYLNKDWKPEYGGDLELWNEEFTECVQKIAPNYNRCVIFSTTSKSWHGHPDPLKSPLNVSRNSIALYYYSNGRPIEEQYENHSTIWKRRPQDANREGDFASEEPKLVAPKEEPIANVPILNPESAQVSEPLKIIKYFKIAIELTLPPIIHRTLKKIFQKN